MTNIHHSNQDESKHYRCPVKSCGVSITVKNKKARHGRLTEHKHDPLLQIEIDVLDTIREIKVRAATEKGITIPVIYQKELEKIEAK
jgi:hypothetical protein